ncbi:MAG: hypothetical protein U1E40_15175 [Amaricoccus sp.]
MDDEVAVLKMAWHPAHFDNDRLSSAAFERSDLIPDNDEEGRPRFVSVDEKSCIVQAAVDDRIQNQGARKPEDRKDARFAEYLCRTVRNMKDEAGEHPLEVTPERLQENPAHCGIRNVSRTERSNRKRRDYADELRSLLIEEGKYEILSYDMVFSKR